MEAQKDNWDTEERVLLYDFHDVLHMHCQACYQLICKEQQNCVMTRCIYCDIWMHSCKIDDHETICLYRQGPCPNSSYGCPYRISRHEVAKHLSTCPANVVQCGMEWNRYPLYSRERYTLTNIYSSAEGRIKQAVEHWLPFPETNPPKIKGELDIEFALSDQRKLIKEKQQKMSIGKWKLSRKQQVSKIDPDRISRLASLISVRSSDEKTSATTNGLFVDQTESQTKELSGTLSNEGIAYENAEEVALGGNNELMEGEHTIREKCEIKKTSKEDERGIKSKERLKEKLEKFKVEQQKYMHPHESSISDFKSTKTGDSASWRPKNNGFEFQEDEKPEFQGGEKGEISKPQLEDNVIAIRSEKRENIKEELTFIVNVQAEDFHDEKEAVVITNPSGVVPKIPARYFPHVNNAVTSGLGLNVIVETIPKFQKNYPMYSIPCKVSLRRDQYCSHFKNVHDDIHGGLNHWLQHRCPLSQYGCPYVRNRLRPGSKEGCLVFDQSIDNFGVRPSENSLCEAAGNKPANNLELVYLPIELIERITNYLDSYSINQFAKTCKVIREICRGLLQRRGIVLLDWKRGYYADGTVLWRVHRKRWLFTPSFSHVDLWQFTDEPPIGEHLKRCQFFDRLSNKQKLRLPMADFKTVKLKSEWRASFADD